MCQFNPHHHAQHYLRSIFSAETSLYVKYLGNETSNYRGRPARSDALPPFALTVSAATCESLEFALISGSQFVL